MTDTIIELSEDEFDAQYKLRTNHLNPNASWAYGENRGCLFEADGEELAFVRQQDPRTVWTLIDGDDGAQYVLSGFHLVNRIGYLISTLLVPEGTTIQIRIPMQSEEDDKVAAHTPEPWNCDGRTTLYATPDESGEMTMIEVNANVADAGWDTVALIEAIWPGAHANARRICAAVNACKAISTEALEHDIIADLRHLLGELVSAAGDLDAAIDGMTDGFDAERAKLNATIRAAQSAIDAGTEIDLHELLAGHRKIAVVWCIEDVQDVRPDLTDAQAWEVLRQVKRNHDADIGINWYTLEWNAEDLFGDAPETAAEQK